MINQDKEKKKGEEGKMKTSKKKMVFKVMDRLICLGIFGFLVFCLPAGAGADGPWTTFGYVQSAGLTASYTTWKAGTSMRRKSSTARKTTCDRREETAAEGPCG